MLLNLSFRIIRLIMETYWGKAIAGFFIPFFSISPHSFHLQKVDDVANCSNLKIYHGPYLIVPIFLKTTLWKITKYVFNLLSDKLVFSVYLWCLDLRENKWNIFSIFHDHFFLFLPKSGPDDKWCRSRKDRRHYGHFYWALVLGTYVGFGPHVLVWHGIDEVLRQITKIIR